MRRVDPVEAFWAKVKKYMTFEFDVELVVRLDNIVIEADSVGEAKREAKLQCREFGNIVDFRITESGTSG